MRYAIEVYFDPALLGGEDLEDEETGGTITRQQLVDAAIEYRPMMQFILDWQAGMFHLTHEQYQLLPEPIVHARQLFNARKAEAASKSNKPLEADIERIRGSK